MRLLIVASFLLVWQGVAGRDLAAAVGGSVVLTAALIAYSHFLGPVGLPDTPLRIFERSAPGASAHWLTYRQEALIALPVTFAVTLAGFLLLARADIARLRALRTAVLAFAIGTLAVAAVGAAVAPSVGPNADRASARASGAAQAETGAFYGGPLGAAQGSIILSAVDRNPRVTPLPPHDSVRLSAEFTHPDGHRYVVTADRPMVDDPLGRFTTWWGVGLDVWHHGRSGIGTSLIPATESKVAVFALGTVERDGIPVASAAPVHAMTMDGGRMELDVGDPTFPLPGLPNGHLRVVWSGAAISTHEAKVARYAFGVVVLAALLILVALGLRSQGDEPGR
ncbi:MAG: hypothetical protein ABR511_00910 [Acidimicrobiales bacterium]